LHTGITSHSELYHKLYGWRQRYVWIFSHAEGMLGGQGPQEKALHPIKDDVHSGWCCLVWLNTLVSMIT
jgi:hypothetical protein